MNPRFALGLKLAVALPLVGCATLLGLDEDREIRAGSGGGGGIGDGGAGGDGTGGAEARYVAAVLADAPVAFFRFEETSGPFVDSIDPERAFTVLGTVEHAAPGAVGAGVGFNGGSGRLVLGPADFGFVGTAPMTIEAWARTANASTFQDVVGKFDVDGTEEAGYALRFRPGMEYGWFFSRANPTGSRNMRGYLTPDVYAHIVMTFDGTASVLYLNGAQVDSQADASDISLPSTPSPFRVGGLETGNAFSGTLDELAIYDEPLSADRVLAHYEAGSTP
ncbi:MAG: LamG domain-containing protein [Polyangiaceae bacterium]|nr:LamG domain-containing protein [Polyangiaceae bacterium]